jgi:sensor histidine kinase YesM
MNPVRQHALQDYFQQHPSQKKIIKDFLIANLINLVAALFLTFVIWPNDSFSEDLVFSICIGNCAYLMIEGLYFLLRINGRNTPVLYYGLVICIVPFAFYLGSFLAAMLLGYNIRNVAAFQSRQTLNPLLFTLFICLLATWFFWNRSRMAELAADAAAEKAKAAAIEKQAMQAQLQLLQAQIEPHMLFNTLANLQALITIDTERAQHMLDQFIQYLRASLSASRAQQTTLRQEFDLIRAYLELMTIRMGARLHYQLDLPPELQNVQIAPMLLQPLVENAIKHGIEPKLDGGAIVVSASADTGMLHLAVRDSGLGLAYQAMLPASTSQVGNQVIRERLQALHGDAARFSLDANTDAGATAHIYLPLSANSI